MIGTSWTWLLVVLVALTVARITRLITEDAILDRPRLALQRRNPNGSLAYFVTCPWCVSVWVAAGVAAVVWNWPHPWWVQVPLLAASASQITGMLSPLTQPKG